MKHILYAIEAPVGFAPVEYKLVARSDENGFGSPLVWAVREDAETHADSLRHLSPNVEFQVVPLTGRRRLAQPPLFFDANQCGSC